MAKKYANQSTDWREIRRFRAWELDQKGWTQPKIAEALGVTQGAVSQWLKLARTGGEALRAHKAPGATPRLTAEQKTRLLELLKRGAESFGFRGDLWTAARVAEVIRREFGVSYHRDHVGRILRDLHWSVQKPLRRASQRNEEKIRGWTQERWPELKKKPRKKAAP